MGPDKVSLPGSGAYNATLASYFSLQSSAVHPLCIVSPQTASDVSAVVKSLASDDPDDSCGFAIRSGGHMWISNSSNAPGGVTVDLRALNSIDLSPDNSTVSVGVGAVCDAVYAKLDPLGLSVAGGRVGGVGVGVLTLGGGLSYFGPRYGWTCDTVSALEVVLADGSIMTVNEEQQPDVFHGLRGGSNNFGIVTRVDLETFDQGLLWFATTYNPLSAIEDHIRIFTKLAAAENYDENASFIASFGYSQARDLTVIFNQLAYTKPVENPPYYQELLSLPSVFNSSSINNMTTLAQQTANLLPSGAARYVFTFPAQLAITNRKEIHVCDNDLHPDRGDGSRRIRHLEQQPDGDKRHQWADMVLVDGAAATGTLPAQRKGQCIRTCRSQRYTRRMPLHAELARSRR